MIAELLRGFAHALAYLALTIGLGAWLLKSNERIAP